MPLEAMAIAQHAMACRVLRTLATGKYKVPLEMFMEITFVPSAKNDRSIFESRPIDDSTVQKVPQGPHRS